MFLTVRRSLEKIVSKKQYFTFRNIEKMNIAQAVSLNQRFREVCILSKQFKALQEWKTSGAFVPTRSVTKKGVTSDQIAFDPSQIALEVTTAFKNDGIDCVVGGSLVIMTYTLPRMTKDVDFNVDLKSSNPQTETILRRVCAQNGWEFVRLNKLRAPASVSSPENKDLELGLASMKVKGVLIDVFLNDWAPAEFVHTHANEVSFPSDPPKNVRIAPPEAIAFFRSVTFSKKSKRWEKDLDDVKQLLRCCPGMDKDWVRDQLMQFQGESGPSVGAWENWVEEVAGEDESEDAK